MAEHGKDIKLTDNPLTNIQIMLPLLDEEAREKLSLMIFGSVLFMPKEKELNDSKGGTTECI